jgi:hypothetical protein
MLAKLPLLKHKKPLALLRKIRDGSTVPAVDWL